MRRPWGLRFRVLAAAGTIAVVAAVTFGLLLNALLAQNRAAAPARAVTEARNAIGDVQRLSQDLETGARGYLLTQEETFLDPYDAARRELPAVLRRLAAVRATGAQRRRIDQLRGQLDAYTAFLADVVARGDNSAPTAVDGRQRFDAVRKSLADLDAAEREELLRRRAQSADLRERSIITASIGFAVLLGLIGLISYGAVRAVVIPVGRLQRFARALGARRYGARCRSPARPRPSSSRRPSTPRP
ncbi:CHASE3 domain-containing protein [Solirubrobacter phytolaccae]|uniref:CHASE3 domain-containing protein n=1 Tax=Solirubrobacter phytolaccae TaxID=1404360 RepID=A0A9X3NGS0_9ACTN|nr:CHASE3 domain-containing protein [Solirubrobacter phytolaccae]MDA0180882.1 CHASE3 domain-containing protein [Solirubrobacter phytolaccae]